MSEHDLPEDVRALIVELIDSVVQLEVLLLLHSDPDRAWSSDQLARELRIDARAAEQQLAILCSRGLLRCPEQAPQSYQYAPRSPALHQAVGGLQRAYTDRRVTVIGMIYSKPTDALRSFADAFRIRKERDDG